VEKIIRIGLDTSKHVYQLHGVDSAEEPVLRKKLRRKEMVAFFQKLAPTVIAIEACGGSHHLARSLATFGHEVKLIPITSNRMSSAGRMTRPMPRPCARR
jgi:transposase